MKRGWLKCEGRHLGVRDIFVEGRKIIYHGENSIEEKLTERPLYDGWSYYQFGISLFSACQINSNGQKRSRVSLEQWFT